MASSDRAFTVVIAVDLSEITDVVLEHGLDAASRRGPAEIHVVSVVPVTRGFLHRTRDHSAEIEALEHDLRPHVADIVSGFAETLNDVSGWRVHIHVRAGEPVEEIIDLIDETRADLVVMGRHGWAGGRRGIVGSVSDRVLRIGRCSTLLVQPVDYEPAELSEEEPCAACTAVRRDTNGDNWFCARHHDNRRVGRLSTGPGASLKPGGLF